MATMVTLTLFGSVQEMYVNPLVASSASDAPGGGSYVALGDGRSVRVQESAETVQAALNEGLAAGGGGGGIELVRYLPTIAITNGPTDATFPIATEWWVQRTTDAALGRTMVEVWGALTVTTITAAPRTISISLPVPADAALPVDALVGTWNPRTGTASCVLAVDESTTLAEVSAPMAQGIVAVSFSYLTSQA